MDEYFKDMRLDLNVEGEKFIGSNLIFIWFHLSVTSIAKLIIASVILLNLLQLIWQYFLID